MVYFSNTGVRVFPVPELTFPTLETPTVLMHPFKCAPPNGRTDFASLPLAPFNISHPDIWMDYSIEVSLPTSWNFDLGTPFVFDIFSRHEGSDSSEGGVTVTRYRLDIEWENPRTSNAPSYMLSVVDTFTMKNGPNVRYKWMGGLDIDALDAFKCHSYVQEVVPSDTPNFDVGFTSFTIRRKSVLDAVSRGLEQAGELGMGRETTAVVKLCTVMVNKDDGGMWTVCGRSGRAVAARTVTVSRVVERREAEEHGEEQGEALLPFSQGFVDNEHDEEDQIYQEFVVHDLISD